MFAAKPELRIGEPASYRLPFFYVDGSCELQVPPGTIRVTAERGYEHERPWQQIEAEAGQAVAMTLRVGQLLDAAERGWISGDTHIHWVTEA